MFLAFEFICEIGIYLFKSSNKICLYILVMYESRLSN